MRDLFQKTNLHCLKQWQRTPLAVLTVLVTGACGGDQSALNAAGTDAAEVSKLFWIMSSGAVLIWFLVMGTAIAATIGIFSSTDGRSANKVIIGGGIVFPTVILAALLYVGLQLLPTWQSNSNRMKIHVQGEQWWWRINYELPQIPYLVTSANEIHMPVGEAVEFVLTSDEVIHSFWIPSLGGKRDMFPGRTSRMLLEATKPGTYRGVCAEYCGTSHTDMAFTVIVHEQEDFSAWLKQQASQQFGHDQSKGRQLFLQNGCGGCHRIAGVSEKGEVGPDLTHFGSRKTLGAGMVENNYENLLSWISNASDLKAGAKMPRYDMLSRTEISEIANFLTELK